MKKDNSVIQLKNVTKSFKIYKDKGSTLKERIITRGRNKHHRNVVLSNINLSIEKGEVVGLIGENGSGKSTALKIINRIIYPETGEVVVQGRVSSLIELGAGFHQDLSGRENIYTNAAIFGLKKKEIDERLNDIIDFSELWDFIDSPVRTYSSGMYMRLAFSVAINVDADILLIDEILAVGDKNFQKKCFDWLEELKNRGTTIVIVTHDTSSIEKLCSRAVWICDGKIAQSGNPEYVINKYYEYMYEQQFELEKRLKIEKRKIELEKKDFARQDITEMYQKFLKRVPESEETIDYYFDNFDKKRDIEHYLKYSPEHMAIIMLEKQGTANMQGLTRQEVIETYQKYLLREPDNDQVIVDCCKVFKNVKELISMILSSSEYKMLLLRSKEVSHTKEITTEKVILIKDVYFVNNNGEKTDKVLSGGAYELCAEYTLKEQLSEYVLEMEIYAASGILCFKNNTLETDIGVEQLPKVGTMSFRFTELHLFPGRYKLFVSVTTQSGGITIKERSKIDFEVESKEIKSGEYTWAFLSN